MSFRLRTLTCAVLLAGSCRSTQAPPPPLAPKPSADDFEGVLAVEDLCPDDPETINGDFDDDGCPDELPDPYGGICESTSGLWIGGVGGPVRPRCSWGHPVFVATFDDSESPREIHRLSALAGRREGLLAEFAPAVLAVDDSSGAPARAATATYTGLDGEVRKVRAGMDGRLVLDRAQIREGSTISVEGCGAQKALLAPKGRELDVTLPRQCVAPDARPSLNIAFVIDADAEIERERVQLAESLPAIVSALRRSHGVVPRIAVFDVSGAAVTFTEDGDLVAHVVRGAPPGDSIAPREALAVAFSRASEAVWPADEANVLVLLSRRSPFIDGASLAGVDRLRRAGVRVHPVMGRAPSVIDEAWARWISAMTGGDTRLRAVWGDMSTGGEVHPSDCRVHESLEWSIIRMLREESDGMDRSPPLGLLHGPGAREGVHSRACSGAPAWRLIDSPERGIVSAYGPGEADLGPEFESALDDVLGYLNVFPDLTLTIIGHCDNLEVPSKRGRAALSLLRAKRARALLVQRGVSPERILVEGLGAESPDDDGDSAEARARNRRIEMEMEFRVEEQNPAPGL